MPIQLTCSCGAELMASDELAGKTAQCPRCSGMLSVPEHVSDNPMLELLDEEGIYGSPQCPNCIPPHAVVCIKCGYDKRLGRKRTTGR